MRHILAGIGGAIVCHASAYRDAVSRRNGNFELTRTPCHANCIASMAGATDNIIEEIALAIGQQADTVRKWRSRGKVPHHIRFELSEAARQSGHVLTKQAFDYFHRSPEGVAA